MKNIIKRAFPFIMAAAVIFCCSIGASAAVLVRNIADMQYELKPADTGYTLVLEPDPAWNYYERYLDGSLRYTATGASVEWNSQERLLDNIDFKVYPLGNGYMMPADGINVASYWTTAFYFTFRENTPVSQDFNITITMHTDVYDSEGALFWSAPTYSYTWTRATTDSDSIRYIIDSGWNPEQNGWASQDMDGMYIMPWYEVGISGIENEDVSTNVNFTIKSTTTLNLPVSQSFGDLLQNDTTNSLLGNICQGITESNSTIDQVLNQTQENNALMQEVVDGIGETNDHLDQIVNGQVDPDAPSGSDEMKDAFDQESEIIEDNFQGFQEFESIEASFLETIETYAVTFLALQAFINALTVIPCMEQLLMFSLALGVLAVLLNIIPSLGNRPYRKVGDE